MKWSPKLHIVTLIAAIAGFISLVAAWVAGADGTVFGFSQEHFFNDANALLLTSIAFGIGTLIHLQQEK